jgi:transposase-like protein
MDTSNPFKGRHSAGEIILLCVRWYLRYALSYRDLEEMMLERGLKVNYSTIGSVAKIDFKMRINSLINLLIQS